jgi:thiamine biosynthesis lipoprotein
VTVLRSSFPALGGEATVATEGEALELARRMVEAEVRAIDETCSRFRADSELMLLNGSGGRPFRASPLLIEALQAALRAARQTEGLVDPTVGGAMLRIGYDDDFERLPEERPALPLAPLPVPGWRLVRLEPETRTVLIPAGTTLDLGATAKALAADRAALAAYQATGAGTLVSLAGDVSVAGPCPPGGWTILVAEDHRRGPDASGPRISIQAGGLATSSRSVRRWKYGEAEHHHLVDPRTGLPSRSRWRTASVAAASCVDANAAATAAIVMGDSAEGWLRARGLPARLVRDDGEVRTLGGWPPDAAG